MVMLADGHPVTPDAGASQGYKITPRQLDAAINSKTRLLLLNSPCTPTGACYTRAELRALGDVLLEHPRVVIGTDDMYEKIYWGSEPFCSLLTAVPELYNRTVTINGVSKAYAMTGWRIGYCGGPKPLITAMSTIQGQSTSNAASMTQRAAVVSLNGDQTCVAKMNEIFKQRHDFVVAGLNALPGVSCVPADGAFYAFADVSKAMAAMGMKDDHLFTEFLLNEAGVAVVAGSGFGAPGHMRISFATSMENLQKALERMGHALARGRIAKSA
jgi:aspartate aminotransferase